MAYGLKASSCHPLSNIRSHEYCFLQAEMTVLEITFLFLSTYILQHFTPSDLSSVRSQFTFPSQHKHTSKHFNFDDSNFL